jgi:cellulose synthase/poly-beta-1,6-N-acetylglucosamine synthase-like glycosyltransferase
MLVPLAWLFISLLALAAAYRAILAIAYLVRRPGSTSVAGIQPPCTRFLAIVPAHNEELLIGDLIASIRRADYPQEAIDVLVIADNCTDSTADVVRTAGEEVIIRHDLQNRGKGQAIDWTLRRLDLGRWDAVAFFDADNIIDPDFFRAMHAQLAQGHRCLQGYYGIANPGDSLMTRLLSVTYVMKNLLFNGT